MPRNATPKKKPLQHSAASPRHAAIATSANLRENAQVNFAKQLRSHVVEDFCIDQVRTVIFKDTINL